MSCVFICKLHLIQVLASALADSTATTTSAELSKVADRDRLDVCTPTSVVPYDDHTVVPYDDHAVMEDEPPFQVR